MKGEVYERKMDILRWISCSNFGWCCPHKIWRSAHTSNTWTSYELPSRLRLTDSKHVFWTETNLSFLCNMSCKQQIKIQIKLTVSDFCFFITIHNAYVLVDSNSSISVSIQNWTHVHMNFYTYRHYHIPKYWPFLLNHPVFLPLFSNCVPLTTN
jgi:hypothetical protein